MPILRKRRTLWPLVLIPYGPRSHTRAFTGRRVVKDVKASFNWSELRMDAERLTARLLFPRWLLFEVEVAEIEAAERSQQDDDILVLQLGDASYGRLLEWLVYRGGSAAPRGRVLLNLGEDADEWLAAIRKTARDHPA
jgi:hypothetical protein